MEDRIKEITVPKFQIDKLAKSLKDTPKDAPITFTYVLMCLFPSVWTNIQSALQDAYTKGYLQAKIEFEKKEKI